MSDNTLLARQPIYDAQLNVHAYELLFRSGNADSAQFLDGDSATSTVLLNAFTALPISDVLEGKPAFVNFTRELLDSVLPVDATQLVIEVLEDVVIDASTIAALTRLKGDGYRIALDDYVHGEHHVELLKLADIVKIDVLNTSAEEVCVLIAQLRPYGLRLVAEKVETAAMFRLCREQGFVLFQGYFLSRPEIIKGRKLNADQQTALRLLAALRMPGIEIREVERLIQNDAVLALKVLRLINSPIFAIAREVDSIQRAVMMLGIERIRGLAQLMILSGFDAKPRALFASTLLRARLCQVLAERLHVKDINADSQFTVGLLSTLDAYLDMDCKEILAEIPIPTVMKDAILNHTGIGGILLDISIAFEQGDLDRIDWAYLSSLGIIPADARDLYIDSLRWVSGVMWSIV